MTVISTAPVGGRSRRRGAKPVSEKYTAATAEAEAATTTTMMRTWEVRTSLLCLPIECRVPPCMYQ